MSLSLTNKLEKLNDLSLEENQNLNTNNIIERNLKFNTPNKCLYVRRLNDKESSKGEINKLIYDSFNNPDQYLSENSPVSVGKNIKLKKIDILTHKQNKSLTKRSAHKRNNMNITKISDISKSNILRDKPGNFTSINNNYQIIDYNTLKNIFDNFRNEYNNNKHLRNNEMSISRNINPLNKSNNSISNYEEKLNSNLDSSNNINYPYDLFHSLDYQNKQINYIKNNDKKVADLSKFISKKINKNEDDLLINKVDLFKYKKEILGGINKDKSHEEKYGKIQWNMSLRRPYNFKGTRKMNINVSNDDRNPLWGTIVERSPNQKEVAVRPGYNLNQKEFIKFEQNENIQKNKQHLNNVKKLDELKVKGSNLLDLEYKREMSTKGRRVLHKVFVENGKTILDQDINNVFGEETLYKNYENKNKYNYNLNDNKIFTENNSFEGENFHYKIGSNGKKSRIISSISRTQEKNRNNSKLYNNILISENELP